MSSNSIEKSIFYEFSKRFLDIVFSLILFVLFLPIIITVGIAIKVTSSGPIFADTPERIGRNGKPFKMYKFRSMIQNAHDILREDPRYSQLFSTYKKESYKLKDDPRITTIGRFIRKHSLDEIPQIFNVLRGEMSLVGPRAYYSDELREQQKKYPHARSSVKVVLSVKPGITGFWQVSGRSEINFDKRIRMDANYVHGRSIMYDLWIISKTPGVMITGKGAL